jgi:Cft2 family RNA processing exonuclease
VSEGTRHPRQLWGAHKLNAYHLVLYNNVAFNTVEFAKSHLEWMNDAITNTFDTHRTNAFSTRFLHYCHSREQLTALGPKPKLVMASMGSLEVGPARDLFVSWAANPRNLVLFTDMGQVCYIRLASPLHNNRQSAKTNRAATSQRDACRSRRCGLRLLAMEGERTWVLGS